MELTIHQVISLYETVLYSHHDICSIEFWIACKHFTYKGIDVFCQTAYEDCPIYIGAFDRVKSIKKLKKHLTEIVKEQHIESFEQLKEKLLIEVEWKNLDEIDFLVLFNLDIKEN